MMASETERAEFPEDSPAEGRAPQPGTSAAADSAARLALVCASSLLAFMLALEVVSALGFFVRVPVGPLHVPFALLAAIAATAFVARSLFGARAALSVFGAVLAADAVLAVCALLLAGAVFDVSREGQTIQQEGVIQLTKGWTPLSGDERLGRNVSQILRSAKGAWMQEAALFRSLGHIEPAKALNLLLMLAAFAVSLGLLLSILPRAPAFAVLLAAVAALNPVAVSQAMSFCLDGQVASLLAITLSAVCLLLTSRNGGWVPLTILAAATVLLVNATVVGVAYRLILLSGTVLFLLLGQTRLSSRTVVSVFVLAVFAGVCVVGFDPYVNRIGKDGGDPLTGSALKTTPAIPRNLEGRDRVSKVGMAVFARSVDTTAGAPVEPKWPVELRASELFAFGAPDVRGGGFGPLFGLAAVLAAIVALLSSLDRGEERRGLERKASVLAVLIAISVVLTPDGWWARYAPQLWLLPVVAAAVALRRPTLSPVGLAARALCLLLVANVVLVGYGTVVQQGRATGRVHETLARLAAQPPVQVRFATFESNRVRLAEAGVRFTVAPSTLTTGGAPFPYSEAVVFGVRK